MFAGKRIFRASQVEEDSPVLQHNRVARSGEVVSDGAGQGFFGDQGWNSLYP